MQEIAVPTYVREESATIAPPTRRVAERPRSLLGHVSEATLLEYGVPAEWMADVRGATEDTVLAIADHLPAEAAEAVLELAVGGTPQRRVASTLAVDPFEHPDARRRFRTLTGAEELEKALEYPWEQWTVFLHPAQREVVERDFNGSARVAGSAGTGKTIVALHRAVHMARRHPDGRVLLTTFSEALANGLRIKLGRLAGNEPRLRERLDVAPVDRVAFDLHTARLGAPRLVEPERVHELLRRESRSRPDLPFALPFVISEWEQVVDAWQLRTWDEYRDVQRLGRKTRLPEFRRQRLWSIFAAVRAELDTSDLSTPSDVLGRITAHLREIGHFPYDHVVIDEAQDVSVAQMRFLAALGHERPDALFFAGDLGQRIFQLPFSWKSLDVDVRGRSSLLRVNYRTSHQIRAQADRLLDSEVRDVDGQVDPRGDTVSVFNGPQPTVAVFENANEELRAVGAWLSARARDGLRPEEMVVLVRSDGQMPRAREAIEAAQLACTVLDDTLRPQVGCVASGTMHLSKGLEFRAVAVMACDDEVVPLQERIEAVTDDADLAEMYATERHLLYVACTRARDHLMVSGVEPESEFLRDLQAR
ncbi:MAG TPA: 3'-5' exonuclease [Gemmatimonadaceae bacterium]|nr:3'-5' exonuclease [Gemmatimonadaceae bacterium]